MTSVEGAVKWFEPDKGYGFISPDGGGKDVFIHITALRRSGVNALDPGQLAPERGQRGALGLDENDRVGHVECVSPGSSTTTLDPVADSTSDLKASASVSIGGNVL